MRAFRVRRTAGIWILIAAAAAAACGKKGSDGGGGDGDGDGDGDNTGGMSGDGDGDNTGGMNGDGDATGGTGEPDTCENGMLDAGEADEDCGGVCATKCGLGSSCEEAVDCDSHVCASDAAMGGGGNLGGAGNPGGAGNLAGQGGTVDGPTVCQPPICGDGFAGGDEECDAGDEVNINCGYDEPSCEVCSAECEMVAGTLRYCGDGVKEKDELCDGNGCNAECDGYLDSCVAYLEEHPDAENGVGTVDLDGSGEGEPQEVYCDMDAGGVMYLELGMGQYDETYEGYELITVTLLKTTVMKEFFLWAYNSQSGLINIDIGFDSDNCCFSDGEGSWMGFGESLDDYLYPGNQSTDLCSPEGGYTDEVYTIYHFRTDEVKVPPLPDDFFVNNPVGTADSCGHAKNPGFFMKRIDPAN